MTSIRSTRAKAVTWSVAGLALIGLSAAGAAQASSSPSDTSTTVQQEASDGDGETADDAQDASVAGTVAAPEQATEQDDTAEQAALTALADVTAEQAAATAVGAVPGTAGTPQLEDEDGWVVWSVVVTDAQGAATEVVVDAGNGQVLATQADDDQETADDAGDADGETADDAGSDA
ncbi:PepSY domain-containing protein [Cellulomonas soli]|uniref:PepSY domain-containing protein n=1 Tax=Cellulomonas soli TaxID=931535 RepID=A0A512PHE5_9CELL|nr:PepSY domain-containing protein [Cellulomonas soli]NYI60777.1 putative membrane protein YkoI [Cellulomonas soli]GEP70639.1 hypothetical protein CSO01_33540 [Cellulomonas soli]